MKIAIVGAGIAGLTAAYDLLRAGHEVILYEANPYAGGLAAGFQDETWEWSLDHFYHHLFRSDKHIIDLVEELGIGRQLLWRRPVTSVIYRNKIEPFDSPKAWITFPGFNLFDVARFGLVSAYLRFTNPWRRLEKQTADTWLRRWYGDKIYETTWRPMLIGKFGPHYQEANMAWMWARLKVRSPRLGYFAGGFQTFVDALQKAVEDQGGQVRLDSPVSLVDPQEDGSLKLSVNDGLTGFDRCLVTIGPGLMRRMVPALPQEYLGQLGKLKSMGAVVLVLALKKKLMDETYWLNLPATSADKSQGDFPFLALVEHTNYMDSDHYGGDHIVYCGDYVTPDHEYLKADKAQLEETFTRALVKINPEFKAQWIRESWLFRTAYAQPVPEINHSRNIPKMQTPIRNLFFASMSQVYPWDRGTNFAVEIGRKAAQKILNSS